MRIISLLIIIICSYNVRATTFYIDPESGNISNSGSYDAPWSTLEDVINANFINTRSYSLPYDQNTSTFLEVNPDGPIHAGDTLMLRSGLHGTMFIRGAYNEDYITIMAEEGHNPILSSVEIMAGSHWRFDGIEVSSEPYGTYLTSNLIYLHTHGFHGPVHDVEINNCFMYATIDSDDWTQEDWLEKVRSGIRINADRTLVTNCRLLNVNFGISMIGDSISVINNMVENFSGDGVRTLGPYHLIQGNTIKNCYKINDNHDDGIQSFNLGTYDTRNVVIRGNTILNYEDPEQPLRGPLQGIGCFDGPFTNWIIENNVIAVDHWHGISLYGAYNVIIRHNTVIDITPNVTPGPSWIRINPDKTDNPSENNIVTNNISNSLNLSGTFIDSKNHTILQNEYDNYFADYSQYDFSLLPMSPAIDDGDFANAASIDILGVARPQGNGYDIGAYEFIAPSSNNEIISEQINLYPNPSTGILYTQNLNIDLDIYTLQGRHIDCIRADQGAINLSHLPAGNYIVKSKSFQGEMISIIR